MHDNRGNPAQGISIILPEEEKQRYDEYKRAITKACGRIHHFASLYHWEAHTESPLITKWIVYHSKYDFDSQIIERMGIKEMDELPKTFSAVVIDDVLLSVTPEIYEENYPDGREDDAYEKLLTHELAHQLHIRILQREEDKMGPRCFFEGFSILAADQFVNKDVYLTEKDLQEILHTDPSVPYKYYKAIIKRLLEVVTLPEAVKQAGDPEFNWTMGKLLAD